MAKMWLATLVLCIWNTALAQSLELPRREKLGEVAVSDLYVEPQFILGEPRQGTLNLGDSFFGVAWKFDKHVRSTFQVGTPKGLNKPFFYGADANNTIALRQAYGSFSSDYGTINAGLIPITYGLEGGMHPAALNFPDSRIYSQKWIPKNDLGVGYEISHKGFQVEFEGHNGETATNSDNQTWMTARWTYRMEDRMRMGFSGITGRTTPDSTASTSTNVDFDFNQPSRVRIGNAFVEGRLGSAWLLAAEYHLGSLEQNAIRKPVQGWHFDAKWQAFEQWAFLLRYEDFTRNTLNAQGQTLDASVGVAFVSPFHNYDVYLIGTRTDGEGKTTPSHQALLVWKLAPLY